MCPSWMGGGMILGAVIGVLLVILLVVTSQATAPFIYTLF